MKNVKGQTYLVILLAVIVPVLLLGTISFGYLSGTLSEQHFARLETIREDRILVIQNNLQTLFSRLEITLPPLVLNQYPESNQNDRKKSALVMAMRQILLQEPALKGIYLFDENFAYNAASIPGFQDIPYNLDEKDIPGPVRIYLQQLIFDKPGMAGEVDLKDTTSQLAYFLKIVDNGALRGYAAVLLDYTYFDRFLEIESPYHLSLYNNRYQIVGDNQGGKRWKVIITEHTERILDGFSENNRVEGRFHSYRFIDLVDTELFLDVSLPEQVIFASLGGFQVTVFFYTLVLAMLALLIGWSYGRAVIRYGESLLMNKSFNRDMSFFTRMDKNIRHLQNDINTILKVQTNLNYLRNDLSIIIEEMPDAQDDKIETK